MIIRPQNPGFTHSRLQRYLTAKNPIHSRGTVSVFQFSALSFERTLVVIISEG